MHDYWIGDHVWIASLQQEGIFEGKQGDLAIVKVGQEKNLFPFSDITIVQDEEVDFKLQELGIQTKTRPKSAFEFPESIDLHIEDLNPNLINSEPALILSHQRSRLKDFVRSAIDHHRGYIIIIHGKGEGVLRSEVLKILHEFSEVKGVEHEPHGGAVKVYFI